MFRKKSVIEPPLALLDPQENLEYEVKKLRKITNVAGKWALMFFIFLIVSTFIFQTIFDSLGLYNSNEWKNGYNGYDSCTLYYLASISDSVIGLGLAVLLALKSMRKETSSTLFPFKKVNLKLGVALFLIGLAFMSVSQIISAWLCEVFNISYPPNPYAGTHSAILLMIIRMAIIPAIFEELMFRGIILSSLKQYGNMLAVVVSAVLFSFVHANFAQIPFALLVGFVFGFIAIKTNSLLIPMLLHFTNNFWSCIVDIIREELGKNIDSTVILVSHIVAIILGVITVIYLIKMQKHFFKVKDDKKLVSFSTGIMAAVTSPYIIIFFITTIIFGVFNS